MHDLAGLDDVFERDVADAFPALYRFAVTLSSASEADDLVQDALARAWSKRGLFDPQRGSIQTWLLAILADQARGRWRRQRLDLRIENPAVSTHADARSTAIDVARAVADLAPRQRDALVLRIYVDLPLAEIATLMHCSIGTVKATLHAARAHVAATLGETYVQD